jgi:hypothetical protein
LLGVEVIGLSGLEEALAETSRRTGGKVAFAISGAVLGGILDKDAPASRQMLRKLHSLCDWFVYGFPVAEGGDAAFREFFAGDVSACTGLHRGRSKTYRFEQAVPECPLSGLSFEIESEESSNWFKDESVPDATTLIRVNGHSLLFSRAKHPHHDYLLSEAPRINLDAPLSPPRVASDFYAEVLPAAFALRAIFGRACWHNPFPTGCVIVDDPLLREKYGFFNYHDIQEQLRAHEYSLTVAFIPRNFRRSDPAVAGSILKHRDRMSICVHGCDHTRAEFGETDTASLQNKAATALENMRRHEALTGLPFDRAMVFPHGAFSSCSPATLKKCGYLAAVNTVPYPTDLPAAPTTIGDLFELAIPGHASFPVFTRRYPRQAFDFAVDLFWGKPVLVTEHHDYFRHGARRLTEFVMALNDFGQDIQWLTLENALVRAAHYQSIGENSYRVRFVTSTFVLRNPLKTRCTFRCSKPEEPQAEILRATVDGKDFPHTRNDRHLSVELELEGGEERTIRIEYRPAEIRRFAMPTSYRIKALVRRRLAEFRDNHLSKSPGLLSLMVGLKNLLLGDNQSSFIHFIATQRREKAQKSKAPVDGGGYGFP